jgi:hypothetical protein
MTGPRKTLDERIAEELKRQEQSRAALAALKARARILDRKADTRRKVILGAVVDGRAKVDSGFHETVAKAVQAAVIRPADIALLRDFFPEPSLAPPPPARPLKSPGGSPKGAAPA